MVANLLCGQFAWRPLYGGQLSRGQFAAISCRVPFGQVKGDVGKCWGDVEKGVGVWGRKREMWGEV